MNITKEDMKGIEGLKMIRTSSVDQAKAMARAGINDGNVLYVTSNNWITDRYGAFEGEGVISIVVPGHDTPYREEIAIVNDKRVGLCASTEDGAQEVKATSRTIQTRWARIESLIEDGHKDRADFFIRKYGTKEL